MKTIFLIRSIALFIVALSFADNGWSQEGSSIKFGIYGGMSNPTGAYKDSLSRARNGYALGISGNYFFPGSGLGIGIDARMIRHAHQMQETTVQKQGTSTLTTSSTYTSPLRFRHTSITLGPVYHIGEGSLGIDLYAKGGMLFERFPTYIRKQTIEVQNPIGGGPFGGGQTTTSTFVYDHSTARKDKAETWTGLFGAKISYELFRGFEIFAYGDYQTTFGKEGRFTVEDLRNGQPPQTIPIRMVSFGGGIRLSFGDGRDPGTLRDNF